MARTLAKLICGELEYHFSRDPGLLSTPRLKGHSSLPSALFVKMSCTADEAGVSSWMPAIDVS